MVAEFYERHGGGHFGEGSSSSHMMVPHTCQHCHRMCFGATPGVTTVEPDQDSFMRMLLSEIPSSTQVNFKCVFKPIVHFLFNKVFIQSIS